MNTITPPLYPLPAIDLVVGNVMVTHNVEWVVDDISTTRYGIHVTVHHEAATGVFTYGPSDTVEVRS